MLIDFWSTGCGPCRAIIEATAAERAANREHPAFKTVFLTGDEEPPEGSYNNYVDKNLADDTSHRIPQADYNRIRSLFRFSSIPHYVLFDPDGRVVNDDFNFYNRKEALKPYGITLSDAEE